MWLLDTKDLYLKHIADRDLKVYPGPTKVQHRYGILSHRWEDDGEPTFDQYLKDSVSRSSYSKIEKCCEVARSHGLDLVWVDTCCIDKRSSAELQEAINSMYRFYQCADVCFVYLRDVSIDTYEETFVKSEWFTRGWETTLALGERIRKLYVEQLGYIPANLDAASASGVYLRATPIPRALESVQQAFTGLYPPATRPGLRPPTITTRTMQDETLFPNEGACKRFGELANAFAERTAKLYNSGPELAYINKKIGKWMPADSPVVKVDSHPRLSGVMDTVNATLAHGPSTRLPNEFYDKKLRADIDKVCVEEWFVGYMESNEYRKLGIGGMVGDLTQHMVEHAIPNKSSDIPDFKISLAGCHDTTIAATLTALGAMDATKDKWPNFTSNIAFELFKRTDSPASNSLTGTLWPSKERTWWSSLFSSPNPTDTKPTPPRTPLTEWPDSERSKLDDYYVRIRYNDTPVTIPFCRRPGRHYEQDESFCTLAAFKEAADSFTPGNWKAECASNLGRPAMNGVVERPPGL